MANIGFIGDDNLSEEQEKVVRREVRNILKSYESHNYSIFSGGGIQFDNIVKEVANTMYYDVNVLKPLFDSKKWIRKRSFMMAKACNILYYFPLLSVGEVCNLCKEYGHKESEACWAASVSEGTIFRIAI